MKFSILATGRPTFGAWERDRTSRDEETGSIRVTIEEVLREGVSRHVDVT